MNRRNCLVLLTLFALALCVAVPAYAAIEISGKIVSVEKDKLTMFDGSSTQNLVIDKDTKVTIKGKEAKVTDLKVDQEVKATVEPDGEKLTAKTIVAE